MPVNRSELSSLLGLLEQVTERVSAMADQALAEKADDVANELFGIERQLSGAKRRLGRFLDR